MEMVLLLKELQKLLKMNFIDKLKVINKGELFSRFLFSLRKKTKRYDRFIKKQLNNGNVTLKRVDLFSNEQLLHISSNPFLFVYGDISKDIRKEKPDQELKKWYLCSESSGKDDIRVTWEEARLQNLNLLVSNYIITKDAGVCSDIDDILQKWFAVNPVDMGINHVSNLEIAIRFLVLYRVWYYCAPYIHFNLEQVLYSYALHIFYDLPRTQKCIPNNHALGEATALLLASKVFNNQKWYKRAKKVLLSRFSLINDNGESTEESSGYQLFATQMLLIVTSITNEFDQIIEKKIKNSIILLKALSDNDGNIAQFGDCDGGLFYCFDSIKRNNIAALSVDYLSANKKVNKWLEESKPLPESSSYLSILERGDIKIAVIGGHEMNHAHIQASSFIIWYKGKQITFSPGTYHYNGEQSFVRLKLSSLEMSSCINNKNIDRNNFVTTFRHKKIIKSISLSKKEESIIVCIKIKHRILYRTITIKNNKVVILDESNGLLGDYSICFGESKPLLLEGIFSKDSFSPEYGSIKSGKYVRVAGNELKKETVIEL